VLTILKHTKNLKGQFALASASVGITGGIGGLTPYFMYSSHKFVIYIDFGGSGPHSSRQLTALFFQLNSHTGWLRSAEHCR